MMKLDVLGLDKHKVAGIVHNIVTLFYFSIFDK